jgi:hypothetical protein
LGPPTIQAFLKNDITATITTQIKHHTCTSFISVHTSMYMPPHWQIYIYTINTYIQLYNKLQYSWTSSLDVIRRKPSVFNKKNNKNKAPSPEPWIKQAFSQNKQKKQSFEGNEVTRDNDNIRIIVCLPHFLEHFVFFVFCWKTLALLKVLVGVLCFF